MTFKVGDYGWVWDGLQWTSWRTLSAERDQQKPLLGFTLFIWIKRVKLDETELLQNIQVLGGRVSQYLDDAVSFVVTDQDPTKPRSSPEEPLALSRGQLILSRVHRSSPDIEDGVIDKARQARIKLWNVSQFLRWIEVHLNIQPAPPASDVSSRKRKGSSRLPRPLVKVEDVQQEYKPVYKVFKSDPAVYVNPLYPSSPFDDPGVQDRFVQLKKSRAASCCDDSDPSDEGSVETAPRDVVRAAPAPVKHQYCECCNAYFVNLQQHIGPDGTHHREFALREENFECVRELIDCFPSLDDFMGNGDAAAVDKTDMHPSAYHLAMLNAAAAAAAAAPLYRPPFPPRPSFDAGQVMVKQEPQDDESPPSAPTGGLLPVAGGELGASVPLDFSRTSQLSDICGQSFPRGFLHQPQHHLQQALPHPPFLPEKSAAEEAAQQACWMGGSKMDATAQHPHQGHSGPQLPLENLSFLDPPQQDAMFTSELPQPDFSFGLHNLLHSICDDAEEEQHRGQQQQQQQQRNVDDSKECAAEREAVSQQYQWPYSEATSSALMEGPSLRSQHNQQPSAESSSSPLELTAHQQAAPSEPTSSALKQTTRRRHSRDDEDATSNGVLESNPNRWTVERTRRGVGLKLKFTPARKQGSSLLSPPTPVRTPKGRGGSRANAGKGSKGGSSFDVFDWNDEEEEECSSDFVKMQWRVLHTEDTKVILCRTRQFALPRKQGKHVGGGKQLVY